MSYVGHIGAPDRDWMRRLLAGKAAKSGRVICRSAAEVEERVGRLTLEREVRERGFRMVQVGDQVLIVCARAPIRILV
ncbi:MAG: N-(5'-phosphoribosyl)anthranilate isomerase [Pseudomonadota bacterium]